MSDSARVAVGNGAGSAATPAPVAPVSLERVAALVSEASAGGGSAGVRLEVPGVLGLLTIRADPDAVPLAAALDEAFGLALPERLSSTAKDALRLRWMSPDEWLLSCPLDALGDVESRLRDAVDGHVAITDVSGGLCVLVLGGPAAREVLAKSTTLDVDPRAFPPGRVASTGFAKTTATLGALDEERVEIVCRRSFADYVARWIVTAAREHGLDVSG